jgi:hypothetical protein
MRRMILGLMHELLNNEPHRRALLGYSYELPARRVGHEGTAKEI